MVFFSLETRPPCFSEVVERATRRAADRFWQMGYFLIRPFPDKPSMRALVGVQPDEHRPFALPTPVTRVMSTLLKAGECIRHSI